MHTVANTNQSIAFGGNTGSEPTGCVWEIAHRNNKKPRIVVRRKVEKCKRVGIV